MTHLSLKDREDYDRLLPDRDNWLRKYDTSLIKQRAIISDELYGNKGEFYMTCIPRIPPNTPFRWQSIMLIRFTNQNIDAYHARRKRFGEQHFLESAARHVGVDLEVARRWLLHGADQAELFGPNVGDNHKNYFQLVNICADNTWPDERYIALEKPFKDREALEDKNITAFRNCYKLACYDDWANRVPINNDITQSASRIINRLIDIKPKKRKITPETRHQLFEIYTGAQCSPQEAFDMDVKLEQEGEMYKHIARELLLEGEPIVVEIRIARFDTTVYQLPTIEICMCEDVHKKQYEPVALLNQNGLYCIHDAFIPLITRFLREFVADPLDYVERLGKRLGKCSVCWHPLKDAESIARGIGPVCRSYVQQRVN